MARGARTHRRFSLGLRARLLFISIALVAVGLLLAQWFISAALDRSLRAHAQEQRLTESSLIAAAVRAVGAWDTAAADPLVREFASRLHDRVTLVAPDGRVVADSAIPAWRLPSVTNHGARPEVVEAIRTGRVSTCICSPQTSASSASRLCTRLRRSMSVDSSRNSSAVSTTSAEST